MAEASGGTWYVWGRSGVTVADRPRLRSGSLRSFTRGQLQHRGVGRPNDCHSIFRLREAVQLLKLRTLRSLQRLA